MGVHVALLVGVHEHQPGLPCADPGHLATKGQLVVGIKQAPNSLALVAGIGALVAVFGNPFFGRMSDRTSSRLGMRRPWMVIGLAGGTLGILIVALAPNIPVVLVGWCMAQLFFNALLAALIAVLPDQVPRAQRGVVSGVLGVCLPIAAVSGTFLVKLFTGHPIATFPGPVRDWRVLHPALRGRAEGPPACQGGQADLVAAGIRRHLLRQTAYKPGLRLGLR